MCRSINFNLYSIGKIWKYLDRSTVQKLLNANITTRLDYCNSLMFGIPKELTTQLQMRQNHAACVITQWRKYHYNSPVLVDLHWLPVKQRIDFNIPNAQSAIQGKISTDIFVISFGELWQNVFCCSCTNAVEQLTYTLNDPRPWSRIKTHLFQLGYFIWLFKCMCECCMLSLLHTS